MLATSSPGSHAVSAHTPGTRSSNQKRIPPADARKRGCRGVYAAGAAFAVAASPGLLAPAASGCPHFGQPAAIAETGFEHAGQGIKSMAESPQSRPIQHDTDSSLFRADPQEPPSVAICAAC